LQRNGCITAAFRRDDPAGLSVSGRELVSRNRKRGVASQTRGVTVESTGVSSGKVGRCWLRGRRSRRGLLRILRSEITRSQREQ